MLESCRAGLPAALAVPLYISISISITFESQSLAPRSLTDDYLETFVKPRRIRRHDEKDSYPTSHFASYL